jgi:purine-binding chemotaxis protein CheW
MEREQGTPLDLSGKYLTFTLGNEHYGIRITKIKEIIGIVPITFVPQVPSHVKGVINLRGKVIPVIDLRLAFGLEQKTYVERTCIILVEVASEGSVFRIGIVVDTVSEVMTLRAEDIEQAPAFGGGVKTEYILGMAKSSDGVKILLDIDQVLTKNAPENLLQQMAA